MKVTLQIEIGEVDEEKECQKVTFIGEFDKAGHAEIKEELNKTIDEFKSKSFVFDFTKLKFINSEGIGFLMELHTHLVKEGKQLIIINPTANVADVFKAIGIQEIIPVYKDMKTFLNQ